MTYTNWHDGRKPGAPYNGASPNVRSVLSYVNRKWGLTDLGCYGVRKIRGSLTKWSAHAFGAAQDLSYRNGPSREVIENEVIPFLVDNAPALGIQRVHDYWAQRYWQIGKGWIERPPGSKNDHLHIETNEPNWFVSESVASRLGIPEPTGKVLTKRPTLRKGDNGEDVKAMQRLLVKHGAKNSSGKRPLVVDGSFGVTTDRRLREFQHDHRLKVDGLCGPKTWAALTGK